MFQQLMTILKGEAPARTGPAGLSEAVAVLLLEAAHRDDQFSAEERVVIARILETGAGDELLPVYVREPERNTASTTLPSSRATMSLIPIFLSWPFA